VIFPDSVTVTSDFSSACNADLIVIATPLNAVRGVLAAISREAKEIPDLILVSKGFEANSGKLSHEIVHDVLPEFKRFGLLLGPSFAKEVALELPTAITLAAFDLSFAISWMQKLKGIPNFRIYAHDDIIGSEVGSAVKNVLAIAVGISDGMQLGFNARAALITRSLNELAALVLALGGRRETIYGLTGIGDLILTCTGDLSRNRQVGLELAKGTSIDAIVNELGHVAEGVLTAKEIHLKAQSLGIDMPIVASVYRIIYENSDIKSEVVNLIARAQKTEFI
jgi:glycerol-3-phosphate dehydrogenase (NAD(P)+)